MLDMGFEQTIRKLVTELGMTDKEERQTMMFSATFPEGIQRMAGDFMKPYLFITVGMVSSANRDVDQTIQQVRVKDSNSNSFSFYLYRADVLRLLVIFSLPPPRCIIHLEFPSFPFPPIIDAPRHLSSPANFSNSHAHRLRSTKSVTN